MAAISSVTITHPCIHGCVLQLSLTTPAGPIGFTMLIPGTGSATLNNVRPFSVAAFVVWRMGSLLVVRTLALGRASCTRGPKAHFSLVTAVSGGAAFDFRPARVTTA